MRLTVSKKLIICFLVMILVTVSVGGLAINRMQAINKEVKLTTEYWMPGVELADEIIYLVEYLRMMTLDNIATPNEARKKETKEKRDELIQSVNEHFAKYAAIVSDPEDKKLFEAANSKWLTYVSLNKIVMEESDQRKTKEAYELFVKDNVLYLEMQKDLKELVKYNREGSNESGKIAASAYNQAVLITIIIILAGIVIGVIAAVILTRNITRPLIAVTHNIEQVSQGNLSIPPVQVKNKDELGLLASSINTMVGDLRQTIGHVLSTSQSVAAAAEQISASTEEIASGSSQQSDSSQVVNEQFKELSQAIDSVARNAEIAAEITNKTKEMAQDGGNTIGASINAMQQLESQMDLLKGDSEKIGAITEVIDDIADQTNLLALNAAIEAARAGEQGRGFAVVADEIRKLAERSGEATKQIASIIKGMQENTRHSVDAVSKTMVLSQQTGQVFTTIVASVVETAIQVNEIAAAGEEQAAQTEMVLVAVEAIAATSHEAAAAAEETAMSTQSLAKLAEDLQESVTKFTI